MGRMTRESLRQEYIRTIMFQRLLTAKIYRQSSVIHPQFISICSHSTASSIGEVETSRENIMPKIMPRASLHCSDLEQWLP